MNKGSKSATPTKIYHIYTSRVTERMNKIVKEFFRTNILFIHHERSLGNECRKIATLSKNTLHVKIKVNRE